MIKGNLTHFTFSLHQNGICYGICLAVVSFSVDCGGSESPDIPMSNPARGRTLLLSCQNLENVPPA